MGQLPQPDGSRLFLSGVGHPSRQFPWIYLTRTPSALPQARLKLLFSRPVNYFPTVGHTSMLLAKLAITEILRSLSLFLESFFFFFLAALSTF